MPAAAAWDGTTGERVAIGMGGAADAGRGKGTAGAAAKALGTEGEAAKALGMRGLGVGAKALGSSSWKE